MPHISAMIPTYNRAHLLGATIESLLRQDYPDIEIVVVDDASTDNTVEVVEAIRQRDPRVRLVVNPKNLGLTKNWNKCLELARGELVQIMQSDDLIDADYFRRVVEVFDTNPAVGFVAASARYIDLDGFVIDPGTPRKAQHYAAGDEAVAALITGGYPHVSSIVMRRECYETLGKFNDVIWHGPDVEMDARLASKYDYFHFGSVHTSFRRHGTNMGNLEYLRTDFLITDLLKKRLVLSYLSKDAQRGMGIDDADRYLNQTAAQAAIGGAIVMTAHGRPDLTRYYVAQALKLDATCWKQQRFWKALLLLCLPGKLGQTLMERRMQITHSDHSRIRTIQQSLYTQQHPVPQDQ